MTIDAKREMELRTHIANHHDSGSAWGHGSRGAPLPLGHVHRAQPTFWRRQREC